MSADGLRVLVPMKPLASAKMRLAPEVDDMTRQGVALSMLDRVVRAAADAFGAAACRVVGGDALVEEVALEAGAEWTPEQGHDLNSSLALALMRAWKEGAKAALVLAGDLPMAAAADLRAVVEASGGLARPVGVMAVADGGTNALLWPRDARFPPGFGERSFSRHQAAAAAAGAPLAQATAAGLAFDLDTAADLEYAAAAAPGFRDAAAAWTRRVQLWRAAHPERAPWEADDDD